MKYVVQRKADKALLMKPNWPGDVVWWTTIPSYGDPWQFATRKGATLACKMHAGDTATVKACNRI